MILNAVCGALLSVRFTKFPQVFYIFQAIKVCHYYQARLTARILEGI